MIVRVYSLLDTAAKAFGPPMVFVNDEVARRGVLEVVRGDSQISKFPGDFVMYYLGDFDTDDGRLEPARVVDLVFRVSDLLSANNGG